MSQALCCCARCPCRGAERLRCTLRQRFRAGGLVAVSALPARPRRVQNAPKARPGASISRPKRVHVRFPVEPATPLVIPSARGGRPGLPGRQARYPIRARSRLRCLSRQLAHLTLLGLSPRGSRQSRQAPVARSPSYHRLARFVAVLGVTGAIIVATALGKLPEPEYCLTATIVLVYKCKP